MKISYPPPNNSERNDDPLPDLPETQPILVSTTAFTLHTKELQIEAESEKSLLRRGYAFYEEIVNILLRLSESRDSEGEFNYMLAREELRNLERMLDSAEVFKDNYIELQGIIRITAKWLYSLYDAPRIANPYGVWLTGLLRDYVQALNSNVHFRTDVLLGIANHEFTKWDLDDRRRKINATFIVILRFFARRVRVFRKIISEQEMRTRMGREPWWDEEP